MKGIEETPVADPSPGDSLVAQGVVARARARRRLGLLLLVVCDLALLLACAGLRLESVPSGGVLGFAHTWEPLSFRTLAFGGLALLAQTLIAGNALRAALALPEVIQVYPATSGFKVKAAGDMPVETIVEMVLQAAERSGVGKVSRVYLVPTPIPNAFTAWVPGLGNVVALHSNLFEFLPREGVRAVITHEVAHIRASDSIIRQATTAPMALVTCAFAFVLVQILAGLVAAPTFLGFVERAAYLGLALVVMAACSDRLRALANATARQTELLADAHAARLCGWEAMANALLLLGERTEALESLVQVYGELRARESKIPQRIAQEELERFLRRFPPGELSEEVAREVAPRLFVVDRLMQLREVYGVPFDDAEVARLADAAASRLERESDEPPAAMLSSDRLTDWRHFDIDASGHLDREELSRLVSDLEARPERMLFRQFLSPQSRREGHPAVRNRILFLARAAGFASKR